MDIDSLRNRTRDRVVAVRTWALEMLDVVPGLRRLVNELIRIGVIDRSMVIAAQGLLALVPLLIVLASFLPHDLALALVDRFESVTGISPSETEEVNGALSADQVRTQTGVIGLLVTLFSATSFARSIQRMYERTWEKRHVGGIRGARRCFLWLLGWLLLLQLVGLLGSALGGGLTGTAGRAVIQGVGGSVLWCWTAYVLLVGRVPWRHLLPGAVVTSVAVLIYAGGSSVVMPRYAANSASQLGTLGLVLAATTWLIGFAFVMVVAAVVGRVLAEDERIHDAVFSFLPSSWDRRSGEKLDQQQRDQDAAEDDQRERSGWMSSEDVDE